MTATAIQQVTTEDVKQGILALIRENNAELKAFLGEVSAKITDTPTPHNGRIKAQKSKKATFTVVEGARVPYSEMPFWKENPHLKPIDFKAQGYGVTVEALLLIKLTHHWVLWHLLISHLLISHLESVWIVLHSHLRVCLLLRVHHVVLRIQSPSWRI